jgi:hypothetical protein
VGVVARDQLEVWRGRYESPVGTGEHQLAVGGALGPVAALVEPVMMACAQLTGLSSLVGPPSVQCQKW